MPPKGAKKAKAVDQFLVKGRADRDAVKAVTEMTKEVWEAHQVGMEEKWPLPDYMNGEKGHMCFKDETFYNVTRWTAETKIKYRPHAKRPGSKSHLRYERYSQAKTVGEALKLSTYPVDWCWDYERGFLKVVGGATRDEPLDLSKVEDESEITDVDRAVSGWYTRELAKQLGMKQSDLAKDVPSGEGVIMRALRLLAQREAKARLEAADREGRIISDDEVLLTLKRWPFHRNVTRKNVMHEDETWVHSDTIGLLKDRLGDVHLTCSTRRYPQVTELFARWLTDRLPGDVKNFTFTSMNVNCNYAAAVHRDNGNFGPSFIKAFGKFTGGKLHYFPEDAGGSISGSVSKLPKNKSVSLDLSNGLAMFNGNSAHFVDDFEGCRYSIVFFTMGLHAKMTDEDRDKLKRLGIPVPDVDVDKYALLRPPRGYGSEISTPKKSELPAYRYYENATLTPSMTSAQIKKNARGNSSKRLEPEDRKSFYSRKRDRDGGDGDENEDQGEDEE